MMVEHRPGLTFITHAALILGMMVLAFPIYVTFVASTMPAMIPPVLIVIFMQPRFLS